MKFLSFEAEGVETYDECRKGRKIRKIRKLFYCIPMDSIKRLLNSSAVLYPIRF